MSYSSHLHTTTQPPWATEKTVQDSLSAALAGLSPCNSAVTWTDPKFAMNSLEGSTTPTLSCTSQYAAAVQNNARPLLQNQEVLFLNDAPTTVTATVKRICREKTGTDWQTVLDIIKYGEETQTMHNELQRRDHEDDGQCEYVLHMLEADVPATNGGMNTLGWRDRSANLNRSRNASIIIPNILLKVFRMLEMLRSVTDVHVKLRCPVMTEIVVLKSPDMTNGSKAVVSGNVGGRGGGRGKEVVCADDDSEESCLKNLLFGVPYAAPGKARKEIVVVFDEEAEDGQLEVGREFEMLLDPDVVLIIAAGLPQRGQAPQDYYSYELITLDVAKLFTGTPLHMVPG
ncbi:hypothetical protein DEU56DRAFT_761350 [Suillus clintonianus]|uniref:uncharacterized protein n=1 Tax=Suillus clintonianus TaxID=1904413 RepID=UPI001B887202|nr:uncharacterized protein DEU56DRAFT_761350 [Suillus clintonianus]KAG2117612.1 hypothetical protein DEU56DRAFT_761350 [Suillus clintonianus]